MSGRANAGNGLLGPLRRGYRGRVLRLVKPDRYKESYIRKALAMHSDPTYLEIGVREGDSFRAARAARKLGVDPVAHPQMKHLQAGEEFFELTSDRFFAERAAQALQPASVHVALIDGLHEFRQVTRDLLNLEPYMHPHGVVFFDDINPLSREMAAEVPPIALDVRGGELWNGDVWKIAVLIARARPDLTLRTIDIDNGVGVLSGFGSPPSAMGLEPAIEECKALDYDELEGARAAVLNLIAPDEFAGVLSVIGAR